MKRMIRASQESIKWQEDVFDGEHFYKLSTPKGQGTVTVFDDDGDWGYDVRIDVKDIPSKGGIRQSFGSTEFIEMLSVKNIFLPLNAFLTSSDHSFHVFVSL